MRPAQPAAGPASSSWFAVTTVVALVSLMVIGSKVVYVLDFHFPGDKTDVGTAAIGSLGAVGPAQTAVSSAQALRRRAELKVEATKVQRISMATQFARAATVAASSPSAAAAAGAESEQSSSRTRVAQQPHRVQHSPRTTPPAVTQARPRTAQHSVPAATATAAASSKRDSCALNDESCRSRVCAEAGRRQALPRFADIGVDHQLGHMLPPGLRYEDVFLARDSDSRQPVPFIAQMRADLPANATRFFYRHNLLQSVSHTTRRYKRCAVVGNGGWLTQRQYGADIDSHALVFRVNQAPTQGYERHVGKRTTHRLLNHEWSHKEHGYGSGPFIAKKHLPVERDAVFLLSRNVGREVVTNLKKVRVVVTRAEKTAEVSVLNSLVVRAARNVLSSWRSCAQKAHKRFVGGSSPSSGIVAVLMSMWICEHVSVFGIGGLEGVPASEQRGFPYQYYALHGTQRPSGNPTHSFGAEASLVNAWARSGLLRQCGLRGCVGGPTPAPFSPATHRRRRRNL